MTIEETTAMLRAHMEAASGGEHPDPERVDRVLSEAADALDKVDALAAARDCYEAVMRLGCPVWLASYLALGTFARRRPDCELYRAAVERYKAKYAKKETP